MSKTGWIVLLAVGTCAGFVIGATVGKSRKPEAVSVAPSTATKDKGTDGERVTALVASLEKYRLELAGRENEVQELREELADAIQRIPPPLTPEEEQKRKEEIEKQKREKRGEARHEKSKDLQTRIVQRKDSALRAAALDELAALLTSDDPEDVMVGLLTIPELGRINFDKERFRPGVVAALKHEDGEVRGCALVSMLAVSAEDETLHALVTMAQDPSVEVRDRVTDMLTGLFWGETSETVMSALRSLVRDENGRIRGIALEALWERGGDAGEIENLAIEFSKEPEHADDMIEWLSRREPVNLKITQRLIEMYREGRSGPDRMVWADRSFSEQARPVAAGFFLSVARESIDYWERRNALTGLARISDASALPELEAIARSPDAEGIENHLADTIEEIRKRSSQPR